MSLIQLLDNWLMQDAEYRAQHNPFIEAVEEIVDNLPEVKLPKYVNK